MSDSNLLFQEMSSARHDKLGSKEMPAEYIQLLRQAAGEGIVMLKNDDTLPFAGKRISVFGRVQYDYFYVGNGSGGDVKSPYKINLLDGLKNNPRISFNETLAEVYVNFCKNNQVPHGGWGNWPTHFPEMPLSKELVLSARQESDIALVIIGRSAGEDRDSRLEEGSFYLTKAEEDMLTVVTEAFEKTVLVINSGNIIDFSWYNKYESRLSALLYVWQGGMESGNAVCDVLAGDISPSGKLVTAIAHEYKSYPSSNDFGAEEFNNYTEDVYVGYRYFETFAKDAVLFPFGYGLSYTSFDITGQVTLIDGQVSLAAKVNNTGSVAGADVVQVYYSAPQGLLGKPLRELAAFAKTPCLSPGASTDVSIKYSLDIMASYDEAGLTGNKSCYVLEPGEYKIYVGSCVRSAQKIGVVKVDALQVCSQLSEAAAPDARVPFDRIVAKPGLSGGLVASMEPVPTRTINLKNRVLANMPKEITPTGDNGYKLVDVKSGKISLETFVAQLDINELEGLTRGDYIMNSPLGTPGNAGVFGGVTESLRDKGVPPITTSDGPSGVRLNRYTALLPCGLALASTWNIDLLQKLATQMGKELDEKGSQVLLAPGMNILRNPLCGRNFEYFSEDPLLSGKVAAAMVRGLQTHGKSACPKHYVCNNQEFKRSVNDSRVSERALREIYLKGFEICVKESDPKHIMTSYNKINGVWGHYHYELCATVLRGEWGYKGNILTDWWMRPSVDPDFPDLTNDAYRVRAQVDVLMPGGKVHFATDGDGSLLESYNKPNGITLAEIQKCAINVLKFIIDIM